MTQGAYSKTHSTMPNNKLRRTEAAQPLAVVISQAVPSSYMPSSTDTFASSCTVRCIRDRQEILPILRCEEA